MDSQRLRETVAAAQNGRPEGFQALLEEFGPRLYGFFFRCTGHHHDAEDLLSDITLRLVRRLKSYDDRGRFEQWLFRIAANMVRDRIRRSKTSPPAIQLSAEDDEGFSLAEVLESDDPAVHADMLAAEASLELQEALGRLEDVTRHMVLLRHFGQLSFKEIADMFNCPVGTVLARVHRGLALLRKWMVKNNGSATG